jgi:hypothetical protein
MVTLEQRGPYLQEEQLCEKRCVSEGMKLKVEMRAGSVASNCLSSRMIHDVPNR